MTCGAEDWGSYTWVRKVAQDRPSSIHPEIRRCLRKLCEPKDKPRANLGSQAWRVVWATVK